MSKEVLLEQLRSVVVKLIQDHRVSHTTIKGEIHSCIKELSDRLPKIKVLYSDVHGGYGYSDHFSNFLEGNNLENSFVELDEYLLSRESWFLKRIHDVKYVEAFGKVCKEKYPFIAKLITIYNKYSLKDVFNNAYIMDFIKRDIKKYDDLYDLINQTDDREFGSDVNVNYVSMWLKDVKRLNRYSKSRLLEWIKNENMQNDKEVQEHNRKIVALIGDARCKLVMNEYGSLISEEKTPWYEKIKPGQGLVRLSFLDAVEEYGDGHFAIWKCQTHYKESAMRFLLKHHSQFEVSDDDDSEFCNDMHMGLLCASGENARLCISEVPRLLDWHIGEYDGLESIVFT